MSELEYHQFSEKAKENMRKNMITPLPEIVVEEHRYTHMMENGVRVPMDGWVFVHLSPSKTGSELPFDGEVLNSTDEIDWDALRYYQRIVEGWMYTSPAELKRIQLLEAGYTKVAWDDVPSPSFLAYVEACIAPLEWHNDIPYIAEMTTIWIKGEWPA